MTTLPPDLFRRRFIQAGAVGLLLPPEYANAQTQQEVGNRLLKLPRTALVIGNSKYRYAPLANPANDGRAIAAQLKLSGFEVTLQTDVAREPMERAIEAYAALLAKTKAIGLFYFAGHGVQLAWRNYLLPVDAAIDGVADIPRQCVDVGTLVAGITKAANAMNVVILDACRDNPFGSEKQIDQKGLSQLDAPPETLLAYATSPGNVASDGDGANGLYTENLLRELKVPETKIEDVFKRVRLGVRRRSNGQQIPWESTSLEEDFYFFPPKDLKEISEADRDRQFSDELAQWEKIKASVDPVPLEEFLRRYPSGPFSELAQLHLERALAARGERRVRIASQEGNPFTKGSAEANLKWQTGDRYTYRLTNLLATAPPRTLTQRVDEITGTEVRYNNGIVTDLLGNVLRRQGGREYTANQSEPLEYVVGKQWSTQYRITTLDGNSGRTEMDLRIAARETITVPAGTFNAFRIEGRGIFQQESGRVEITTLRKWVAPDRLRREVAMEETRETSRDVRSDGKRRRIDRAQSRVTQSQRWELMSFSQG